jgi:hypothetical protein
MMTSHIISRQLVQELDWPRETANSYGPSRLAVKQLDSSQSTRRFDQPSTTEQEVTTTAKERSTQDQSDTRGVEAIQRTLHSKYKEPHPRIKELLAYLQDVNSDYLAGRTFDEREVTIRLPGPGFLSVLRHGINLGKAFAAAEDDFEDVEVEAHGWADGITVRVTL